MEAILIFRCIIGYILFGVIFYCFFKPIFITYGEKENNDTTMMIVSLWLILLISTFPILIMFMRYRVIELINNFIINPFKHRFSKEHKNKIKQDDRKLVEELLNEIAKK